MKALFSFLAVSLLGIIQASSQGLAKIDRRTYYTSKPVIKITTLNHDTLTFTKWEFNQIIDSLPCLFQYNIYDPDINYHNRTNLKTFLNKEGDPYMSFTSEAGQDDYYILYAYFLKQRTGEVKYTTRRNKLTQIYNTINRIFSRLHDGGTYYGHQFRRISGYVEYSIYWYSQREDFFTKSYNITAQKKLYLSSIRQLIKDELPDDGGYEGWQAHRIQKEKELNAMVNTLDTLIDDSFYLKRAQAFQYSYY